MLILGVDPGTAGAYALLDDSGVVDVGDLPVHQVQRSRGGKQRAELDLHALQLSLQMLIKRQPIAHVFIEAAAARPGQGVVSMFRFGYAAGAIYGLVVGLGLPVTLVRPQEWQRGIGPSADAARQRAVQLYPAIADRLQLKRDGHRADAVLIADYGLHQRRSSSAMEVHDAA